MQYTHPHVYILKHWFSQARAITEHQQKLSSREYKDSVTAAVLTPPYKSHSIQLIHGEDRKRHMQHKCKYSNTAYRETNLQKCVKDIEQDRTGQVLSASSEVEHLSVPGQDILPQRPRLLMPSADLFLRRSEPNTVSVSTRASKSDHVRHSIGVNVYATREEVCACASLEYFMA